MTNLKELIIKALNIFLQNWQNENSYLFRIEKEPHLVDKENILAIS